MYVTGPFCRKTGQYISGFTAGGAEFQNISLTVPMDLPGAHIFIFLMQFSVYI